MVSEEWRDIPGHEGWYQVSDLGRVRSLDRLVNAKLGSTKLSKGQVLAPRLDDDGYLRVGLWCNGARYGFGVHQLVLLGFEGPASEGLQVRHLNGDSQYNAYSNLSYGTAQENADDRQIHGTQLRGEVHGKAKLTEIEAWAIKFATGIFPQKILAEIFGIKQAQVSAIQLGQTWKHL